MQDVRASLRPTFERSKMGFMKALKWQFLPAVVCFNLAYLISYLFPFWCFILIVSGLAQVIYGYYNSMSVSHTNQLSVLIFFYVIRFSDLIFV